MDAPTEALPPSGGGDQDASPLGGDAAFAALYEEHSQAIYYLALRMLGDAARAEDVTHDVFLKAFRHQAGFRRGASWRTWLYRITINHCLNLRRSWQQRQIFNQTETTTGLDLAVAPTDSPSRILETKELGERIQAALAALPDEARLLLLLVADEELSYEEIGSLTGQSADAVRGKLHRARKLFARHFGMDARDEAATVPAPRVRAAARPTPRRLSLPVLPTLPVLFTRGIA